MRTLTGSAKWTPELMMIFLPKHPLASLGGFPCQLKLSVGLLHCDNPVRVQRAESERCNSDRTRSSTCSSTNHYGMHGLTLPQVPLNPRVKAIPPSPSPAPILRLQLEEMDHRPGFWTNATSSHQLRPK